MTLNVSATIDIHATPESVLLFVLDLDRYRQADHKITGVTSVTGPDENGKGSARVWGKLPGLPTAPDRQDFTLDRWSRLTLVGAPHQPGRLIFDFVGSFECTPIDNDLTRVTHAYEFTFRRPFRWLERRMAAPLAREIDDEVERLAEILETEGATTSRHQSPSRMSPATTAACVSRPGSGAVIDTIRHTLGT